MVDGTGDGDVYVSAVGHPRILMGDTFGVYTTGAKSGEPSNG